MFLIDFSYPDFFTGKIYYCLEVVCAFSAGRKVADETRVQAFVIRIGGRVSGRDKMVNGLGELLRLVQLWSEWSLRTGSGAAQGGLAALQPQH